MRTNGLKTALVLLAVLAGCGNPPSPEVHLAPGVPFHLCLPREGPPLFLTQEVVFTLPGGGEERAVAVVENRGGLFSVVASSPMGQTLFIVRMEGAELSVDTRIPIPGDLDPRVLPALVQLVLWPAEAVRRGLGPGAELLEEGPKRTLLRKGRPVWTATRAGELTTLDNPGLHLSVRIRTVAP